LCYNGDVKIKCALHNHTHEDPQDKGITYNAEQFLHEAHRKGFSVVAFTFHRTFFFPERIQNLARELGILLIPGIEIEIKKKHILVLNADKTAEKIRSFDGLREYRVRHKDCFVIAAHPFFGFPNCLGRHLKKNLDCFDGVEHSFFHTKRYNRNRKAEKFAKNNDLPFIATADCHLLDLLDVGYVEVECGEKTIDAVFHALRHGDFSNVTRELGNLEIVKVAKRMMLGDKKNTLR